MTTGDKVLTLLAAKLVCCLGLSLAGAGLLGGAGAWLFGTDAFYALGGALAAAVLWVALGRRRPSPRRPQAPPGANVEGDAGSGGAG